MSQCTKWVDKGVIQCKQWSYEWTRTCKEWASSARQECDRWADEGEHQCDRWETEWEKRCDDWDDQCCDWWPCSWACKVVTWVCVAWTWVSSRVCTAWVWVSRWVCKAWVTIVEWTCVAVMWVARAVCVVWSWVAKVVCVAWDTARCAAVVVAAWIARVFGRREPRRIEHVFVLMLENRSYDHMLGYSDLRGVDAMTGRPTVADNLLANPGENVDPADGSVIATSTPADFAIPPDDGDPPHEFLQVVEQLAGRGAAYPFAPGQQYPPIDNSGFVAAYRDHGSANPSKIMECFSPEQLPILNTLASEFAVCDRWFSSMPGPTWPNRFFVHAASAAGLDDSPGTFDLVTSTLLDGYRFDNGTLFDSLEDRCLDWLVFEGDETPQVFALSGMTINALQGRFRDFEDFRDSVNDPGFPASYTFIEPHYGNIMPWTSEDYTCGNSQHPLDDVTRGERLIKDVYEAIRNSPHWKTSVLIVTWDEHGGFFDHVAPSGTVHPGDSITDNDNNHHDFDFTQLGPRVPAVVVSPLIPRGTIDHTLYDHSSVLATVEDLFGLEPLTRRDARANSLAHLFSLETAREDAPTRLPPVARSGFRCTGDEERVAPSASSLMLHRPLRVEPERIEGDETRAETGEEGDAEAEKETWKEARHEPGEPGDDEPIDPLTRGFMHVAFLRARSLAPYEERSRIVDAFLAIETNRDARRFVAEARDYIWAQKNAARNRTPWSREGKGPIGGGFLGRTR